MAISRRTAALELLGFYGTILIAIWVGQKIPVRPPVLALGAVLLAACALSNRRHGDSREKIGLDPKYLKPCARSVLTFLSGPLVVMALLAARLPPPSPPKILFAVLGYPLWAFAQDYALLSFSANRLRDVAGPRPWTVSVLNGILFSLVHLPNPILGAFTLIGGAAFTRIFLRTPHLVPIALAHAAAGFLVSLLFQFQYNVMMVGPAYLTWAGVPGPHP